MRICRYGFGRDGYFVPHPIRMEEVLLGPGQRFSAIVIGGQAGPHAFKSVAFKFDERQPPLPDLDMGRSTADVAAAEAKANAQHVSEPLYVDVARSSPIAHRRTFTFSVNPQMETALTAMWDGLT